MEPGPARVRGAGHLQQRFEEQARQRPQAVALILDEHRLSYGELNARANRLAHCLIARGVGADVPVGLALERSLDMLVGLLAILKAGGACRWTRRRQKSAWRISSTTVGYGCC